MLPASMGFITLAHPIINGLFGGGKFDSYSADVTAKALLFYSFGLTAYGATKILQCCFFALKDTVTPAKVAGLALVITVILDAALMFPMKLAGLALANSLSGINTSLLLFFLLKRKIGSFGARELGVSFLRIFLATLAMGVVCFFVSQHHFFVSGNTFWRLLELGIFLIVGVASYVVFCFILRVREMYELKDWLLKRRRG